MRQISIKEEKIFDNVVFPLTLAPSENLKTTESIVGYIKENYDDIMSKLLKHGAILFRGFSVNDAKDFNDFSLAFGWKDLPYIGEF